MVEMSVVEISVMDRTVEMAEMVEMGMNETAVWTKV